jgi:hypothetical protein
MIQLADCTLHWWDFLNMVMDVQVSQMCGISGQAEQTLD